MDDLGVQVDLYPQGASRMIVPIGVKTQRQANQDSMNPSLEYMMAEASMAPDEYPKNAREIRTAIQQAKRKRSAKYDLGYERFTDCQLTDSWATRIFPNVQIGLHPEGAFLMRFMPHPTEPERFFYDTMTLIRPVPDPIYKTPGWMGLPEGTDTSVNSVPTPNTCRWDNHRTWGRCWTRIQNCFLWCSAASSPGGSKERSGASRNNASGISTRNSNGT